MLYQIVSWPYQKSKTKQNQEKRKICRNGMAMKNSKVKSTKQFRDLPIEFGNIQFSNLNTKNLSDHRKYHCAFFTSLDIHRQVFHSTAERFSRFSEMYLY